MQCNLTLQQQRLTAAPARRVGISRVRCCRPVAAAVLNKGEGGLTYKKAGVDIDAGE